MKNENHATAKNSRAMKILTAPFHMAPSCLALNSYLVNTDRGHSMVGSKVWEERGKST